MDVHRSKAKSGERGAQSGMGAPETSSFVGDEECFEIDSLLY